MSDNMCFDSQDGRPIFEDAIMIEESSFAAEIVV